MPVQRPAPCNTPWLRCNRGCYVTSSAKWLKRECNGEIVGEIINHSPTHTQATPSEPITFRCTRSFHLRSRHRAAGCSCEKSALLKRVRYDKFEHAPAARLMFHIVNLMRGKRREYTSTACSIACGPAWRATLTSHSHNRNFPYPPTQLQTAYISLCASRSFHRLLLQPRPVGILFLMR